MLSPGSVTTVNAGEQPDLPEAGSPSAQRSGVLEARSRPAPDCQPIRFEAGPAGCRLSVLVRFESVPRRGVAHSPAKPTWRRTRAGIASDGEQRAENDRARGRRVLAGSGLWGFGMVARPPRRPPSPPRGCPPPTPAPTRSPRPSSRPRVSCHSAAISARSSGSWASPTTWSRSIFRRSIPLR